jgi:hypothetical protein
MEYSLIGGLNTPVSATSPQPLEGTHADAGRAAQALRPPPGATGSSSRWATASSTAKRPTALAAAVMDRTPPAPRSGPASATASGFGATEACRRSRKRSRPALPRPRNYSGVMPPKGGASHHGSVSRPPHCGQRDIAEGIGAGLQLPVESITAEEAPAPLGRLTQLA